MIPIKILLAATGILLSVTFTIYSAIDYFAKADDGNPLSATLGRTRAAGLNTCHDHSITSPNDETQCTAKLESDFTRALIILSIFVGVSASAALVALTLRFLDRRVVQNSATSS